MEINTIKNHLQTLKVYHHLLIWAVSALFYFLMIWYLSSKISITFSAKIGVGIFALIIGMTLVVVWKENWPKMMAEFKTISKIQRKPILLNDIKNDVDTYNFIKQELKTFSESTFRGAFFFHLDNKDVNEVHIITRKFDEKDKEILNSVLAKLNLTFELTTESIKIKL